MWLYLHTGLSLEISTALCNDFQASFLIDPSIPKLWALKMYNGKSKGYFPSFWEFYFSWLVYACMVTYIDVRNVNLRVYYYADEYTVCSWSYI